ncbi:hypothetical protein HMPREF1111_1090 [Streptococcus infantis ATCC 700779]|nr:hypothetical protein HMPREF1111_1090 [Streptococcus infantis ATCC 700779]
MCLENNGLPYYLLIEELNRKIHFLYRAYQSLISLAFSNLI